MQAGRLLTALSERGIEIQADGADLVVRPSSRLTDADRAAIRAAKTDLLVHLRREQDRAASYLTPAESIIKTCRAHGVALRIDEGGDLVVGKAGAKADEPTQPWPSLLVEIEANLEPVARLVEAGWHLHVGFPSKLQ